jgi:hypothetical protein
MASSWSIIAGRNLAFDLWVAGWGQSDALSALWLEHHAPCASIRTYNYIHFWKSKGEMWLAASFRGVTQQTDLFQRQRQRSAIVRWEVGKPESLVLQPRHDGSTNLGLGCNAQPKRSTSGIGVIRRDFLGCFRSDDGILESANRTS